MFHVINFSKYNPSQINPEYKLTGSGIQGYFPVPVIVEPRFVLTETISSQLQSFRN
jgi:hypothetical protein